MSTAVAVSLRDTLKPLFTALKMMLQDPPDIVLEIGVTIIRFFVLGLIILFFVLLAELVKNIITRKIQPAIYQGLCCSVICISFYFIFGSYALPMPTSSAKSGYIVMHNNTLRISTAACEQLGSAMREYSGNIVLNKNTPRKIKNDEQTIKLVLTYEKDEVTVYANAKSAYMDKNTDKSLMCKIKVNNGELYQKLEALATKENAK